MQFHLSTGNCSECCLGQSVLGQIVVVHLMFTHVSIGMAANQERQEHWQAFQCGANVLHQHGRQQTTTGALAGQAVWQQWEQMPCCPIAASKEKEQQQGRQHVTNIIWVQRHTNSMPAMTGQQEHGHGKHNVTTACECHQTQGQTQGQLNMKAVALEGQAADP